MYDKLDDELCFLLVSGRRVKMISVENEDLDYFYVDSDSRFDDA